MKTIAENCDIATLIQAIKSNDIFQIKLLTQGGVNVNQANRNGTTPLHMATEMGGNPEVVKALLEAKGIEVNQADNVVGQTSLHHAALMGNPEVVEALLNAKGIEVNQVNRNGTTPLHFAALKGYTEVVYILLGFKGIAINKVDINGTTPLHIAAQNGHLEVVKALLENGADYSQLDSATQLTFKAEITKIDQTKKVFAGDLSIPATEINENYLRYLCKQSGIPEHLLAIDQDKPNRSDCIHIVNRIQTDSIDIDINISKGVGKKRKIDEVDKSSPAPSTQDPTSAPYLELMRLSINSSSSAR